MKKNNLIILGVIFGGIFLLLLGYYFLTQQKIRGDIVLEGECEISEMVFYYTDWCPWCRKVKDEGTISNLKKFGVNITEINVDRGKVEHEIRGIPAFIINDNVYEGYRSFEELKELLICSEIKYDEQQDT